MRDKTVQTPGTRPLLVMGSYLNWLALQRDYDGFTALTGAKLTREEFARLKAGTLRIGGDSASGYTLEEVTR